MPVNQLDVKLKETSRGHLCNPTELRLLLEAMEETEGLMGSCQVGSDLRGPAVSF